MGASIFVIAWSMVGFDSWCCHCGRSGGVPLGRLHEAARVDGARSVPYCHLHHRADDPRHNSHGLPSLSACSRSTRSVYMQALLNPFGWPGELHRGGFAAPAQYRLQEGQVRLRPPRWVPRLAVITAGVCGADLLHLLVDRATRRNRGKVGATVAGAHRASPQGDADAPAPVSRPGRKPEFRMDGPEGCPPSRIRRSSPGFRSCALPSCWVLMSSFQDHRADLPSRRSRAADQCQTSTITSSAWTTAESRVLFLQHPSSWLAARCSSLCCWGSMCASYLRRAPPRLQGQQGHLLSDAARRL